MIKSTFTILLIILSFFGFGQSTFIEIDKKSKKVNDSLDSYSEIAKELTINYTTEKEKARAIYIWIAHNIRYDLDLMGTDRRYNSSEEIIDEVLARRQGVCQHYSELFQAMCSAVGIQSYLITGYTRGSDGKISDLSHAWNAVRIDSAYYLVDATWAAGYEQNGKYVHKFRDDYFLREPQEFIRTHMPFDPMWQFMDHPISHDDFLTKNFSELDSVGNFMFVDSIRHYEQLDALGQLTSSNRRISKNGIRNKLIQDVVDDNSLRITQMKYNLAINNLNFGVDNYNLYIIHKNKQFKNPNLEDIEIKELIENADRGIYAANESLFRLISADKQLNALITDARNKIPPLITAVENEKVFVEKYIKKWKPLRMFMFLSYGY